MPRAHKQTLPSLSSLPPIETDPEPTQEVLTSFAGLSLVAETLRALGLPQSVERNIQLKERQRGFSEAQMVQSLLMLLAVGGESVADIEKLRGDPGLPELLGHRCTNGIYKIRKSTVIQLATAGISTLFGTSLR